MHSYNVDLRVGVDPSDETGDASHRYYESNLGPNLMVLHRQKFRALP